VIQLMYGGGADEPPIRITITDEGSRCVAVEARVSLEDFAKALFSSGADCAFEFNDSGRIGMLSENKEELVPVPPLAKQDKGGKWIVKALAPKNQSRFCTRCYNTKRKEIWNGNHRKEHLER